MKILVLVSSQTYIPEEEVKESGLKHMEAIFGDDKEFFLCDYSTIEIKNDGQLKLTCLGEEIETPDAFWPLLGNTDAFVIENMLLEAGLKCIVDLKEIQVVRSKIATYQRFAKHGIRIPDTMVFFKYSNREKLVERFGFPFVVKPDSGLGGMGVELIHNREELDAYFETVQYGQAYVAQEYIATSKGRDIRVVMLDGKYYYSMERRATDPNEFRSNVHVGGVTEVYELTDEEKAFCERVASVINLPIMGLDLMIGDGEFVLAEVNGFPGIPVEDMKKVYAKVVDHYLEEQE